MLRDDLSISEQICNEYQSHLDQLDRIVFLLARTEQEALGIVTPLDREQKRLDRRADVMSLQRDMLEQVAKRRIDLSFPETLPQLNRSYQERLEALRQNFIQDYESLLNQRSHYFDQDRLLPLTSAQRSLLLEQFQETLAAEMVDYQAFTLTAGTYAVREQQQLDAEIKRHIALYEALDKQKILTVEIAKERRIFLGERQQQLQQTQQSMLLNPHWNLLSACEQGDLRQVQTLVADQRQATRKQFINQAGPDGRTALHLACGHGHFATANYLLQNGADPLLPDGEGYFPLHYAALKAQSCTTTLLEVLLRYMKTKKKTKESDWVNVLGPYGRTPLHTAALFGNQTAVQWLLQHGANINVTEREAAGRTPLHNAAFKGHAAVVQCLLVQGANLLLCNANNETPLFEALFYGQAAVAEVFRDYHCWLTLAEQRQLQSYLADRPALRQCLIRLLQPEAELHAQALTLESAPLPATQLSANKASLWANTATTHLVSQPGAASSALPDTAVSPPS